MSQQTTTGAQSSGDDINWRSIYNRKDGGRDEDPVITALVKESEDLYIKKITKSASPEDKSLNIYIKSFNEFLNVYKLKFKFTLEENIQESTSLNTKKDKKVKKEKPLTSLEKARLSNIENKTKEAINAFISSLKITNYMPFKNNKCIESFFTIVNWAIYLYDNKKINIDSSYYFNCAISLYRAIDDSKSFLTTIMISESYDLLTKIENLIKIKEGKSIYTFLSNNSKLILESYWDKIKPKSICLYDEQKEIIDLVTNNLNEKKLIFFEMPPANGKTILSAILAKIISNRNRENFNKKKVLLYICYNTIVRNEVAKLCITHNVDVRFWLAVTKMDTQDLIVKTFLRPFMNCYPDWNQSHLRTKETTKRYNDSKWMKYSANPSDQFEFFMNETRRMSSQNKGNLIDYLDADNLPEMIISDLDSAYTLLNTFPDLFITYFDEAFATSNLEITSKIMSVLGHTVLVSATLAQPSEIPTVISDFKKRHNLKDDSFLNVVKSSKQHISCTFIDESGTIFAPHDTCTDMESFKNFIKNLSHPLIKRGYSPDVVLTISKTIDSNLNNPDIKFDNKFNFFGKLSHESLREYACDILRYIADKNDNDLFELLKNIRIKKIQDMNVTTIFTTSAYNYQLSKTLHVATSHNFNEHVFNLSNSFLEGSPKVKDVIAEYDNSYNYFDGQVKSLEKNGNKDSEYERNEIRKEMGNIKLNWPLQYIVNSNSHGSRYNTSSNLISSNNSSIVQKDDLGILDEIREKLLFSSIGVYQPDNFSDIEMEVFLKKKDLFQFIISTPAIVYGTNISLSIIDIDKSFVNDSTKNTLYQLIGRAGRRGKSDSAMIIFRDNEMINMIIKNNEQNIEAIQIESNYANIMNK